MSEAVTIEPYDPAWAERFSEAAVGLGELLGPWLAQPVEHIGSTALGPTTSTSSSTTIRRPRR